MELLIVFIVAVAGGLILSFIFDKDDMWQAVFDSRKMLKAKEAAERDGVPWDPVEFKKANFGYEDNDSEIIEDSNLSEKSYAGKTDELLNLKKLLDEKVLTQDEFEQAKEELLSSNVKKDFTQIKQESTQVNNTKSTCSNCGGTNFKLVRSTGGKIAFGLLAKKNRAQCQSCGQLKPLYLPGLF